MYKLLVRMLNIYEGDRERIQSVGERDGHKEEIGRDSVSLMDNDSPKSQIKVQTAALIMVRPAYGAMVSELGIVK